MQSHRFILISRQKLEELEMLFEHVYSTISDFKSEAEGTLNIEIERKRKVPRQRMNTPTPEELEELF